MKLFTIGHSNHKIGLARGWDEHPARCYLQITGVYTFPDFLKSKTFADFVPPAK
jgi:hypothetical protein